MSDRLLLHLHIPKTGGSTLFKFLQRQYGDAFFRVPNRRAATFWDDAPDLSEYDCVSGHFTFGLHERVDGRVCYLAFMRDPVDRMLSLYHYFTYNAARPRRELEALGLERFVMGDFDDEETRRELWHFTDNDMVRRIHGMGRNRSEPYHRVDEDDFRVALDNLRWFAPIGLVERYDESMARWAECFGWPDTQVGHLLHQPDRPRRESLSPELVAAIENRQSFDCALYAYVLNRDW